MFSIMIRRLYLALVAGLFMPLMLHATGFVVGSYNLRYDNAEDAAQGDGWARRCPYVANLIAFHGFDILGTQEGLFHQLEDLRRLLPDMDYIGVGRDDGERDGEYAAIFYRKDRFELLRKGHFWLSENPSRPAKGWDAACVRICTWGVFRDKISGKELLFMNTHFDHVGVKARRESARLILQKAKELCDDIPLIITGDFNVGRESEAFQQMNASGVVRDAAEVAQLRYVNNGTFNAFHPDRFTRDCIDHVFVSRQFHVNKYGVLTDSYRVVTTDDQGRERVEVHLPSDHFPVCVGISEIE